MNPLVSILIPVYNREHLIGETIESALNQTYINIEIIIADNCSTDGTYNVLQHYAAKDKRIKIFKNELNIGPVKNWIKCIDKSKGEFSKILFSDDTIQPNFIESTLNILLNEDKIGFVFTMVQLKDKNNNIKEINSARNKNLKYINSKLFLYKKIVGLGNLPNSPGCAIFRTNDLRNNLIIHIPNKENLDFSFYGAGNDLLIFLLTALKYPKIAYTEDTYSTFRGHDGSFSTSNDLRKYYYYAKLYFCKKANFYVLFNLLKINNYFKT